MLGSQQVVVELPDGPPPAVLCDATLTFRDEVFVERTVPLLNAERLPLPHSPSGRSVLIEVRDTFQGYGGQRQPVTTLAMSRGLNGIG